ncbi:MAG: hypothetical protein KA113_07910 [Syntrophaceae bacterium]|nr:hypothetical protein [Syntrophaceae bacterium]
MNNEEKGIKVAVIEPPDEEIIQRAAGSILFLPDDWPTEGKEIKYPSTIESVVKLLRQHKIPVDTLNPIDATTSLQDNRGLDWIAPTFLVSSLLLTQNPTLVSVALSIIANYVTDLCKGLKSDPEVKVKIVQTADNGKKAQRINYEGPVSGLPEIEKVLQTFNQNE